MIKGTAANIHVTIVRAARSHPRLCIESQDRGQQHVRRERRFSAGSDFACPSRIQIIGILERWEAAAWRTRRGHRASWKWPFEPCSFPARPRPRITDFQKLHPLPRVRRMVAISGQAHQAPFPYPGLPSQAAALAAMCPEAAIIFCAFCSQYPTI
ncbi:hypothetical protein BD309DRAFT_952575 [Dichomitus squalens]|uniref:Uncharacterized protein n=1 Tax=Dichomitus squalens TaxID=114155 RepID=A0A4Q9Q143_9APHY|nr:hypothetical protein BD309DRAFT_952575 [Dichomitus squalens]TBU60765.1 hypothetical protein BD310DRAFT_922016 [Dichomitus squalens]